MRGCRAWRGRENSNGTWATGDRGGRGRGDGREAAAAADHVISAGRAGSHPAIWPTGCRGRRQSGRTSCLRRRPDGGAISRLGLPGGDNGTRERAVQELQRALSKQIEDGTLFRVQMEYRYRCTRHWLPGLGVEILTPSYGEFVVGDIPALTVRKGMPNAGISVGIGYAFADAIILPIAPDFVLRVVDGPSRYALADGEEVAELNFWYRCGAPSATCTSGPEAG
jgi:hypothetical protein